MLTPKFHLAVLLLLPVVAQDGLCAQDRTLLLGRWQSAQIARNGLGEILELTPTGQFVDTHGALIWGTFRTEANQLIRRFPPLPDSQVVRFLVRGDTMLQWPRSGPDSLRMVRTSLSRSRAGLVGHWTYTHYTGATAYESFHDDGTWRLSVPMDTDTAAFDVRGDTLITTGKPMSGWVHGRYRWSYANDRLRVDGAEFVRVRDP